MAALFAAAILEKRDLIAHFGESYRRYRARVPMFIPRFGTRHSTALPASGETTDAPAAV